MNGYQRLFGESDMRSVLAAIVSISVVGIGLGLSGPLLSLLMEQDGLSSTILFGEARWDCSAMARSSWAHSNNYDRTNTLTPINYDSCISGSSAAAAFAAATAAGKTGCEAAHNWKTERGFKSRHPGVVTVMMADGSVHTVSETIDHFVFNRLGCRADKLAASISE